MARRAKPNEQGQWSKSIHSATVARMWENDRLSFVLKVAVSYSAHSATGPQIVEFSKLVNTRPFFQFLAPTPTP